MDLVEGKTGTAPDGTRVIVRGGKIVPLNGPKPRPDWGPGAVENPDGSVVRYGPKGGLTVLSKGGGGAADGTLGDVREFEANAAARATLMDAGQDVYRKARAEGYNPGSVRNAVANVAEGVWGVGPGLADVIRDKPSERGRAAELQFVDGALRTTSGANAPEPEVRRASRQYFRQPGESPAVEREREALRQRFRDQAVRIAGSAYIDPNAAGGQNNPMDLSAGQPRSTIPKGSYYRDPKGNVRRNDNGDKGNPIINPAARPVDRFRTNPAAPRKASTGYTILKVED